MVLQTISRKSVLWPLHVGIVFWISLTFFYGSGDGSTKSHVASVCGPFVGHLTLLVFFLWPKGEVHGIHHKHPVQCLYFTTTNIQS